jgi:four helix bundle protein
VAPDASLHDEMVRPGRGFEHLVVCQRARTFCQAIRPLVAIADERHGFALAQQLNRAALCVMANIAEGYARRSRKEFAQFVRIAGGSNAEARAFLYAALDRGYVDDARFESLVDDSNEIGRMLEGLRQRLTAQASAAAPNL